MLRTPYVFLALSHGNEVDAQVSTWLSVWVPPFHPDFNPTHSDSDTSCFSVAIQRGWRRVSLIDAFLFSLLHSTRIERQSSCQEMNHDRRPNPSLGQRRQDR